MRSFDLWPLLVGVAYFAGYIVALIVLMHIREDDEEWHFGWMLLQAIGWPVTLLWIIYRCAVISPSNDEDE